MGVSQAVGSTACRSRQLSQSTRHSLPPALPPPLLCVPLNPKHTHCPREPRNRLSVPPLALQHFSQRHQRRPALLAVFTPVRSLHEQAHGHPDAAQPIFHATCRVQGGPGPQLPRPYLSPQAGSSCLRVPVTLPDVRARSGRGRSRRGFLAKEHLDRWRHDLRCAQQPTASICHGI